MFSPPQPFGPWLRYWLCENACKFSRFFFSICTPPPVEAPEDDDPATGLPRHPGPPPQKRSFLVGGPAGPPQPSQKSLSLFEGLGNSSPTFPEKVIVRTDPTSPRPFSPSQKGPFLYTCFKMSFFSRGPCDPPPPTLQKRCFSVGGHSRIGLTGAPSHTPKMVLLWSGPSGPLGRPLQIEKTLQCFSLNGILRTIIFIDMIYHIMTKKFSFRLNRAREICNRVKKCIEFFWKLLRYND